jgi:hypothetical protein
VANRRTPDDTQTSNKGTDQLRGTAGGEEPAILTGMPGGTNALSPNGAGRPVGVAPAAPSGDRESVRRQDSARSVSDGRTKDSESVGRQRARDEADVEGSQSGVDLDSPRQIPEDAPDPNTDTRDSRQS